MPTVEKDHDPDSTHSACLEKFPRSRALLWFLGYLAGVFRMTLDGWWGFIPLALCFVSGWFLFEEKN